MTIKIQGYTFKSETPQPETHIWRFFVNDKKPIDVTVPLETPQAVYLKDASAPPVEVIRSFLSEIKKLYPKGF